MATYITLDGNGPDRPTISVDGVRQPSDFALRWVDRADMPFAGVYIADERQYDTEVWVNGTCQHRVPPEDEQTRHIYDVIEGNADAGRPASQPPPEGHRERVQAEMRTHPGGKAHLRWEGLMRTLDVHERNGRELKALLARVSETPGLGIEMFQNTAPPIVREQIEAEVDQRLHNYVASAATLVDHTRRTLTKYEDTRFYEAYEARRSTISQSPVARFIKDLRNYSLHRELPFVGNTVTIGRTSEGTLGDVRAEIELSCSSLLTWDGWTSSARDFIGASGDTIKLREVLTQHIDLIRELYRWVGEQYHGLHRFEIAMFNELVDEYNWAISGGQEGSPRRFGLRQEL